jgi:chorismate mutase
VSMPPAVRALRGATTVDRDEPDHITERVVEMMQELFDRNDVDHDDIISIIFTTTGDIHSMYPPTAARKMGLGDVPLIGAQEIDVIGGTGKCIRVMLHLMTERGRDQLHHVYLEGARGLRDDLPA